MASIKKRGNSYRVIVSNGRDAQGKQIIETTTFVPDPKRTERQNQKALQEFAIDFERKVKSGNVLSGEKMTYSEYIEKWMKDYAQVQMKPTSVERCETSLNNQILPALGHLKVANIKPLHIQDLYTNLQNEGYIREGKHYSYSANTIKRIHQIISSSLSTAVLWGIIDSNPASRVRPPRVEKQDDVKHFTPEQMDIFLEFLDKPYMVTYRGRAKKDGSPSNEHSEFHTVPLQHKALFYLAIYGGFRRGELIALTWDDIDFDKHTVRITKTAARTKEGTITETPKSFAGYRTISVSAEAFAVLQEHKIEQQRHQSSVGSYWQGGNYVFTQNNGRQMDIGTPNKVFQKTIRRYNETPDGMIEPLPVITLHGLRHTSATILIAEGVDPKTVQNRLGHSEISTTMDIYSHALKKQDEAAADAIARGLKGKHSAAS
ncbi:MAG: site-specific integrase [Lachnospiraceae bacterium]|nr:site-specific integrase [Lachnospiraceae bacterium]